MLEKNLSQDPNAHLSEQYMLPLVSGVGKLQNLQNSKYPNLKPKSLEQYIAEFRKVSPHDMKNPDYVGRVKSNN
ncbi:hypothetical protein K7432_017217 [Basidiobolus ranarum]|uniref:Uncharacterized protein n=1 Tax=Basidiobolus ranarum TaxID=34480 RepID=A0ABR2VKM7_9FUNG